MLRGSILSKKKHAVDLQKHFVTKGQINIMFKNSAIIMFFRIAVKSHFLSDNLYYILLLV